MLKRMPDEMEMDLEPEPMMESFLDMEEEI